MSRWREDIPLHGSALRMLRWVASASKGDMHSPQRYWCPPLDRSTYHSDGWGCFQASMDTDHYAMLRTLASRGLITAVVRSPVQWARFVTPSGSEYLHRAMAGCLPTRYQVLERTDDNWSSDEGIHRCCRCCHKTGGRPGAWLLVAHDKWGRYVVPPAFPPVAGELRRDVLPICHACLRDANGLSIGSVPRP